MHHDLPGSRPQFDRAQSDRAQSDRPQLTVAAGGSPEAGPPAAGRRRHRGRGGFAWLAVVPAGILAVLLIMRASQPPPAPVTHRALVVASLPYWNIGPGTDAVLANRRDVSEVSPWMYGVGSNGQIILDSGISLSAINGQLTRLRAQGLPIVPTLANVDAQGNWSYAPVARVLHDPAMAGRQVAAIVALADSNGYAGIDLDYEELHARGKLLSVALFAKASNAGYAPRNVAQDYAAIGKVADQVRLMGYDYHWDSSPPGPIAPVGWIRGVLSYARTQMPASKIVLGIPQYGYDWSGGHGASVTWPEALQIARQHHVTPQYDAVSQAPWFGYTDAAGHRHTVWFENAASARAKFDLAARAGIGGVYLWMYGAGDPGTWQALHQVLPPGSRTGHPARRGAS